MASSAHSAAHVNQGPRAACFKGFSLSGRSRGNSSDPHGLARSLARGHSEASQSRTSLCVVIRDFTDMLASNSTLPRCKRRAQRPEWLLTHTRQLDVAHR